MKDKSTNLYNIIDHSLTPENAIERGYIFIDNVFDPYEAINEIFDLAAEKGFVFGCAIENNDKCDRLGLYKIMKRK